MSVMSTDQHPSSTLQGSYSYTDTLKRVSYGPGCVSDALPKMLQIIGGTKALVVTGKSLRTKVNKQLSLSLSLLV